MTDLSSKTCIPCRGDTPPLEGAEIENLRRHVPEWEVIEEHHLKRSFRFKNFREALGFVDEVGALAEEQGHHPDITFGWGYAEIDLTTHDRGGITAFDFAVAKEIGKI